MYHVKRPLGQLLLKMKRLRASSFDIAKPGESVRITPVKDVIEPRVKGRTEEAGYLPRRSLPKLILLEAEKPMH